MTRWRCSEQYQVAPYYLACRDMAEQLEARLTDDEVSPAEPPSERQRVAELHALLGRDWQGPTRSPIDGQLYARREEYLQHLIDQGAVLAATESVYPMASPTHSQLTPETATDLKWRRIVAAIEYTSSADARRWVFTIKDPDDGIHRRVEVIGLSVDDAWGRLVRAFDRAKATSV